MEEIEAANAKLAEERRKEAEAHHREQEERAANKRREHDAELAQRRSEFTAWQAGRPPDPNRPPPEQLALPQGPAVIPDPPDGKPQQQ
jgi:hypothetical protein